MGRRDASGSERRGCEHRALSARTPTRRTPVAPPSSAPGRLGSSRRKAVQRLQQASNKVLPANKGSPRKNIRVGREGSASNYSVVSISATAGPSGKLGEGEKPLFVPFSS